MRRMGWYLVVAFGLAWGAAGAEARDRLLPIESNPGQGATPNHVTAPGDSGVTFETLNLPFGSQIDLPDGQPLDIEGYTFTPGPNNTNGFNDSHYGNAVNFWAYNGTHVMAQHDDVIMTRIGGGTFNLRQFDYAGFPGIGEQAFTVTGQPGNIVATFVPDGIVDGPGGGDDFQTFTLPPTFTNLTSVTWDSQGLPIIELDNIGVDTTVANLPPDCSQAEVSPSLLWPADHKLVAVSLSGFSDPDGDSVTVTVTGITQDEPVNSRGDGNTCPDAQVVNGQAAVRAERSGTGGNPGNGRVYGISYLATDGKGGSCSGTAFVCVPHDQGQGATCVDDGQKYNSLGPCNSAGRLSPEIATSSLSVTSSGRRVAVEYSLAEPTEVNVSVFDVAGRRLATIEQAHREAGSYAVTWETDLPRGLYFCRLRAGSIELSKTILIGK